MREIAKEKTETETSEPEKKKRFPFLFYVLFFGLTVTGASVYPGAIDRRSEWIAFPGA